MKHAPIIAAEGQASGLRKMIVIVALALAFIRLAYQAAGIVGAALTAIRYPFELDYGEGIVWQQADQIMRGTGYGSITGFPTIVFHYTPLYHVLALSFAQLAGIDPLMAGRIVSVVATGFACLFAGLIVSRIARFDHDRQVGLVCGVMGALVMLSTGPVSAWSPLMRVDMVSLAFEVAGVWLAMLALERPRLVHLAAISFTASLFARQTAIAAPAAAFLTLLLVKPRTAMAGIATAAMLGLGVLGTLTWATDGGFVRHIFLYNINRTDWARAASIVHALRWHALYVAVAGVTVAAIVKSKAFAIRDLRANLAGHQKEACFLMLAIYLVFAAVMTLTVVKIGSNINYFLELFTIIGILVGIACRDAVAALVHGQGFTDRKSIFLRVVIPSAITVQALFVPGPRGGELDAKGMTEMHQLAQLIHDARKPVISDDMVIVKRAGREVVWEPAIFSELARKGIWDQQPFVDRVRRGDLAFFVTLGDRGFDIYDDRYTPPVSAALEAAYPVRRHLAGHVLHFPRNSASLVQFDRMISGAGGK